MKVLNGLRLRRAILGLALVSPLVPAAAGCGAIGGGSEEASVQATKESESKYEQVIKENAAKKAPKK